MTTLHFILGFTLVALSSCKTHNADIPLVQDNPYIQTNSTLIGKYKTKPPKALFYTDRIINLHSDSTFAYSAYTCVGIDTCYGNWSFANNMIFLKTSIALKKEIDDRTVLNRIRLVDLNNHHISVKPDYLLLQTYDSELDTLIKE